MRKRAPWGGRRRAAAFLVSSPAGGNGTAACLCARVDRGQEEATVLRGANEGLDGADAEEGGSNAPAAAFGVLRLQRVHLCRSNWGPIQTRAPRSSEIASNIQCCR